MEDREGDVQKLREELQKTRDEVGPGSTITLPFALTQSLPGYTH